MKIKPIIKVSQYALEFTELGGNLSANSFLKHFYFGFFESKLI